MNLQNRSQNCHHTVARRLLLLCCCLILSTGGSSYAQERPSPTTVSDEAAEIIGSVSPGDENATTTDEWQALWDENQAAIQPAVEAARELYPATIETVSIAGYDHLLITPRSYSEVNDNRIVVYTHGGSHTMYSPDSTLGSSLPAAHYLQAKVLAVRYPVAWKKPHPASRDVVVAVYKELLKSYAPRRIAMYGDSAGGGLLMSAVLKIRDDGIAMPSVLGLLSPWADVTQTGDSLLLLDGADPMIGYDFNLGASATVYATGQDLKDPSVSPLYADFNKGFPPSYISTGTRDLFLSHCARLQRKLIDAGVENQLVVYEGMWHVFQALRIPEEHDAWRDMAVFFERHWGR